MFCFFPANLMSYTYTDKNNPFFHGVRTSIPNWKPSPNRTSIGFSQIAFPITAMPQDDRTDFAQEERLGLPCWTICVVVDESTCLGIPIWEFWVILEHLPFYLGISRYCVSYLSCATWQSGNDIRDFCGCHLWCWWTFFSEYCIRSWMTPRSTTRPLYVWCFVSNSAFFKWHISISEPKWTFAPFVLASSITSFLLVTFVRFHAEIFFNFSHSLSSAALAAVIFVAWGIRINLWNKL